MNPNLAWERKLVKLGLASARMPQKPRSVRPTGERLFPAWCVAHGFVEPVPEHRFHAVRRWRFDFAWPDALTAVEIEGGAWVGGRHVRGAGFIADMEKYSEAQLDGWIVLRCVPGHLCGPLMLAWLKRAL